MTKTRKSFKFPVACSDGRERTARVSTRALVAYGRALADVGQLATISHARIQVNGFTVHGSIGLDRDERGVATGWRFHANHGGHPALIPTRAGRQLAAGILADCGSREFQRGRDSGFSAYARAWPLVGLGRF